MGRHIAEQFELSFMEKEHQDDIIKVDDGVIFEGTRAEFRQKHFDNANNRELLDWARQHGYRVTVNNVRLRWN